MPLIWEKVHPGHAEDCRADMPNGDRWTIRHSKWGADWVCYFVKLNGREETVEDTLAQAKAWAEQKAAQSAE